MNGLNIENNQHITTTTKWQQIREIFTQFINCFSGSTTGFDSTDSQRYSPTSRRQKWRNFFSRIVKFFSCSRGEVESVRFRTLRSRISQVDIEKEYKMNHAKRGIALIFNHERFMMSEKQTRLGTNKDRDRLSKVLERLNFDVQIFDDLFMHEIDREIRKVSRLNHSKNDCLLVVVMTHGDEKTISCYDADYSIEKLIKPFTDRFCPSLRGKPRIFLIQSCRGSSIDGGVKIQPKQMTNSRYILKKRQSDVFDNAIYGQEKITFRFEMPPIEKDFIILRTTMLGYVSFRNPDMGSWFIQEFCNKLELNSNEDLLSILTHTNRAVSEKESNPHKYKEVLCISTMLTRLVYFK